MHILHKKSLTSEFVYTGKSGFIPVVISLLPLIVITNFILYFIGTFAFLVVIAE